MYSLLFFLPTVTTGFSIHNVPVSYLTPSRLSHQTTIPKKGRIIHGLFGVDDPVDAEFIYQNENEDEEARENYEWMSDSEKARLTREAKWKHAEASPDPSKKNIENKVDDNTSSTEKNEKERRLVYTDEEEELISILGGKDLSNPSPRRENGFLGDSTLREISMDYQVPICYLADVLCGWGVPPPIEPNTILGDMITGEQAFAILEAIHTLDVGSLNDRYADFDLATLCFEYDIELSDGFELAMKEGWNLPFGVRTFLRVEQEEHLIERLAKDVW
jgi:hypothetical protein